MSPGGAMHLEPSGSMEFFFASGKSLYLRFFGENLRDENAPENPTNAPENPTNAPENPLNAPENPLNAPENPLNAPENPINAPENPT